MAADLEAELQALRGSIARVKSDLEALAEAENVLSEKLRNLGLDESITSVDLPTVAGPPSRRGSSQSKRPSAPPVAAARAPSWVPAAVGAGLLLGVAIVVLLALNLQATKRVEAAPALAIPTVTAPSTQWIPPPEPVPSAAPAPPPSSSAEKADNPEKGMGTLSIICTPRCDSIVDNGTPLSPGNLVALPVAAGPHKVVLTAGGVKRSFSVKMAPGETKELRADLEKPSAPDRGF